MKANARAAPRSALLADLAARLISARRFARLSQKDLGERVGLSRDQLATVEQARVPLRFWPGWRICRELNISQIWLMTGLGSMTPFLDLDLEGAEVALGERELFRDICRFVLAPRLNVRAQETQSLCGDSQTAAPVESPLDEAAVNYKRNRILRLRDQARAMLREADRLEREINPAESGKKSLTDSSEHVILPPVKSELEYLLADARRLTAPRGMKAKLARALQVPMPRVSDWLAGNYLPSGERALRLREWVRAQERQQKQSPGGVETTTGAKTQVQKSAHENQTRVRKRRCHKGSPLTTTKGRPPAAHGTRLPIGNA